jgi:hypothetical protein
LIAKHCRETLQGIGYLKKVASFGDYVPITEGQLVEILEQPALAIYRDIVTTLLLRGAATGITVEAGNDLSGFYVYSGQTVFYCHSGSGVVTSADFALVIDQSTKDIAFKGSLTLADGKNIVVGTSTGTKIGTSASQPLGFWNAAPVVQPASADQAVVTLGNTNSEIGGLTISAVYSDTEVIALRDKCEELADDVRALSTLLHSIRTALVNSGLIKGAA